MNKSRPNKRIVILIGVSLLALMILLPGFSFAQLEKPVYHLGDYWEYRVSGDMHSGIFTANIQGTGKIEIIDKTTLTVDGNTYEVWKATLTIEAQSDSYNLSLMQYSTMYRRTSDLAAIKEFNDNEVTSTLGSETSHEEIIYTMPQPFLDYPINVGDSWEKHIETEVTDEDGTTTDISDSYYECTGTTELTTDTGFFSCYILRAVEDEPNGDTYAIEYRSDEVGNFAKRVLYEDGEQTLTMILTDYNYQGEEEDGGNGGIPGFEFIPLILAIIGILFITLRKRNIS